VLSELGARDEWDAEMRAAFFGIVDTHRWVPRRAMGRVRRGTMVSHEMEREMVGRGQTASVGEVDNDCDYDDEVDLSQYSRPSE
jgi:hypothetical protein